MAEALYKSGTQLSFADHAGDFAPAAANDLEQGTPTNVDMAFASVGDTAAVNSDKADLGAKWSREFSCMAAIEFAATPTAGDLVEFYWAPSPDSVAANGNPGGVDGVDGAYTGYSSNLADSVKQLQYIGSMRVTVQVTGTVQIAFVGSFRPLERYGCLVVKNESAASFHSDDVESHVVLTPVTDDIT